MEKITEKAAEESLIVWSGEYRKIQVGSEIQDFRLHRYPFLVDIYRDLSDPEIPEVTIMKSTQVGASEMLYNLAFWAIDIYSTDVLFVMPTRSQMRDAVSARIDPLLENSPHIKNLFNNVSNTGLKTGKANFYARGGQSRSALFEVPADLLIFDEYDKIPADSIELARKRISGSEFKWVVEASNPSFPGSPLHNSFQESTQNRWTVECPSCGTEQRLDWFGNVVDRGFDLGCSNCEESWDQSFLRDQGYWKPYQPEAQKPGYHISQMLSPHVSIEKLKEEWFDARNSTGIKKEAFYNHRLGKPFVSSKSTLDEKQIQQLRTAKPDNTDLEDGAMGIDVGSDTLHFWIQAGNIVQKIGKVKHFEDLDQYIEKYGVRIVICDIAPETRRARQFIKRIERELDVSGWLCRRSKRLEEPRVMDGENKTIKVRNVEHWDRWKEQFEGDDPLQLPRNISQTVINHLSSPVRTINDTDRGPEAQWVKSAGGAAHYADCSCYAREGLEISDRVMTPQESRFYSDEMIQGGSI